MTAQPDAADFARIETADDEVFEMVNLPRGDTGVDGTIYVSSMQGPHGPRVKWYPQRPGRDAPCLTVTLEQPPRVINHGLSARDARSGQGAVERWVALNREGLLRFWFDGSSWTVDEVYSFAKGLAKLD